MKQLPSNIIAPLDNGVTPIPTYIINLKKRTDRRVHVLEQFKDRPEFALNIVEAFEHSFGAKGLWMTIRHILYDLVPADAEYIIIGEDDVEFTEYYSKEKLFDAIDNAKQLDADVLLGGVSWFNDALHASENILWTNGFTGLHFTILFKKVFQTLIQAKITHYSAADHFIASLTQNLFFLSPALAVQKEFGYSDATSKNNKEGVIPTYFESVDRRLLILNTVKYNLTDILNEVDIVPEITDYDKISIPTYIINLPERTERLAHIKQEFAGRPEFDIQVIEACKHEVGALGLWLSIRKVIEMAIANDDDVIIIAEDDHQFTPDYNKEYLIKNIIQAHEEGASYLSGGTGKFNNAMPITINRYWVYHCLSTQFVVIYKKFFQEILDHPYDEKIVADIAYSQMTSNKMVLYPFVSVQKDFGYSDITDAHRKDPNLVTNMFIQSANKFKSIQQAYLKYHPQKQIIQHPKKYKYETDHNQIIRA